MLFASPNSTRGTLSTTTTTTKLRIFILAKMSSTSGPISAERFALAIADLPSENVYAKAAEIRNSMAHLQHSNDQLQDEADAGDRDCAEAISENNQVIRRMMERLELLRHEVERRGHRWDEGRPADASSDAMDLDGVADSAHSTGTEARNGASLTNGQPNGTGTSATARAPTNDNGEADMLALLAARLRENDEHGLHL